MEVKVCSPVKFVSAETTEEGIRVFWKEARTAKRGAYAKSAEWDISPGCCLVLAFTSLYRVVKGACLINDRRSFFPNNIPQMQRQQAYIAIHIEAITSIPRPSHVLQLRVPELSDTFPRMLNHFCAVLLHHAVIWRYLAHNVRAKSETPV